MSPLLTHRQASDFLKISPRSLFALVRARQIPRVKIGRSVRYHVSDLEAFIDRQTIGRHKSNQDRIAEISEDLRRKGLSVKTAEEVERESLEQESEAQHAE